MSLTINSTQGASNIDASDALAIKSAQLAKSQQEVEGQMAMQLIQSSVVEPVAGPAYSGGSLGANIDVYV